MMQRQASVIKSLFEIENEFQRHLDSYKKEKKYEPFKTPNSDSQSF